MDKRIRKIIERFMLNDIIVVSWGIYDIKVEKDKLAFCVNGLIYKGPIEIYPLKDIEQYLVYMGKKGEIKVDLSDIVLQLDCLIERTANYESDLKNLLEL